MGDVRKAFSPFERVRLTLLKEEQSARSRQTDAWGVFEVAHPFQGLDACSRLMAYIYVAAAAGNVSRPSWAYMLFWV